MPQAADQHRRRQIHEASHLASTVAAEGDVNVVAQKSGQGDVPTAPEIDDVGSAIWRIEIHG